MDKEDSVDFRPYDLEIVQQGDVNEEYYTMSSSGVVHFILQQPTEFMSLSDWMKESTMFNVLRKIRFFKYYLVHKCFKLWFQSLYEKIVLLNHKIDSRFQKFSKKRMSIDRKFFASKQTFVPTLLKIHKLCYDMKEVPLMDCDIIRNKSSSQYKIDAFLQIQQQVRETSVKSLETAIESIAEMLYKLCDSVSAATNAPQITTDNIDAYLKGQLPPPDELVVVKKSKSMVEAQKEEKARKRALKKAKEEEEMLPDCMFLILI